jgi:hypothetical protein
MVLPHRELAYLADKEKEDSENKRKDVERNEEKKNWFSSWYTTTSF